MQQASLNYDYHERAVKEIWVKWGKILGIIFTKLKWKLHYNKTLFQKWGEAGIKENDGGGELKYDIRTFVNATMYTQKNNKKKHSELTRFIHMWPLCLP
jgi:hypothetical protein